jgi:hypothetical protein
MESAVSKKIKPKPLMVAATPLLCCGVAFAAVGLGMGGVDDTFLYLAAGFFVPGLLLLVLSMRGR